jgi:hypothetical protein
MNRWKMISIFVVVCVAVGCAKTVNDQDAIRASIEKHLNSRADLNLSAMDRDVKQVSVNGDHATAQVEFRVKGGDAHMDIQYSLQRQGKDWTVQDSQPMGMDENHSGMGAPPTGGQDSGGSQLPQGHPPTN